MPAPEEKVSVLAWMREQKRRARQASRAQAEETGEAARLREERKALSVMKREAKAAGATLQFPEGGGLPNTLVLGVMRRDAYTCKVHGDKGEGDNGGIGVHHKGGLENPLSAWLVRKGKSNDPNNLVTVCRRAHDEVHNRDRAVAQNDEAE